VTAVKTNLAAIPDGKPVTADFAIGSHHEPWRIEELPHVKARPVALAGQAGAVG
jgi:hypothetical protein